LAFWLALWYIAALSVGQELVLPGPVVVFRTFVSLCTDGEFWRVSLLTLLRILSGFAAGAVIGTVLAVLTHISPLLYELFSPIIKTARAVPVASFIILLMLWVGKALVPGFVSALMVIPVMWGAVGTAINETDKDLLEMASAYRLTIGKRVKYIYIPSVLPAWCNSAYTSLGLAWKSGVAAEVICLPKLAIGTNLYYSKIYLETPSLFAWTAAVLILSFLIEELFRLLLKGTVKKYDTNP